MSKTPKFIDNTVQVIALEPATHEPLKVLITRPKEKAHQLALLLNAQGIANTRQTLFDYQNNTSAHTIASALEDADTLIFVSVAAVEFAHASYPLNNLPNAISSSVSNLLPDKLSKILPDKLSEKGSNESPEKAPYTIFAVGNATKKALLALGLTNVISPPSQQEHSEGLLKLVELAHVQDKKVLIFRGNGGREHIAQTLIQRGAIVNYIETYQRVWRTLPINITEQWRVKKINCIVVTSNDILLTLHKYLSHSTDKYWQTHCLWVVASERIAKKAKALGITRVINSHSANSEILCNTLLSLAYL